MINDSVVFQNEVATNKGNEKELRKKHFGEMASFIKEAKKRGGSTKKTVHYNDDDLVLVKKYNEEVLMAIDKFIHTFIHDNYPTFDYGESYNEMYNECVKVVFEEFPRYNGKNELTTFFNPYFKAACNSVLRNGKTRYYNDQNNRINKAIKSLVAQGYRESDITIADIQKKFTEWGIDMSETRIKKALIQNEIKHEEYLPDKVDVDQNFKSPEEMYLEKERLKEAFAILDTLYDYEKIAFCFSIGYFDQSFGFYPEEGKKLNSIQIGENPVFIKAYVDFFGYEGNKNIIYEENKIFVKPDEVKNIVAKTRKKINNHPERVKKIDKKRSEYGVTATLLSGIEAATQNIEILSDM